MLKFIGLGLYDEYGISIRGLKEARSSDYVFAEFYTSIMPGLNLSNLEEMLRMKIGILSRHELEEECGEVLLEAAGRGDVSLLVPGDPMNATTHVELKLRAEKMGFETKIIHAASIMSAISGVTGLQNYKFGRTVTLPLMEGRPPPDSPYDFIRMNLKNGLHTLILLDLRVNKDVYLKIDDTLQIFLQLEERRREGVLTGDRLVVCTARVGGPDMVVRAGLIKELIGVDFGSPPYSIVIPGELHFMEEEALKSLKEEKG